MLKFVFLSSRKSVLAGSEYFSSCVLEAVQFGARLIQSRTRNKKPRDLLLGVRR